MRHYLSTYTNEATLLIHVYEWGDITYSRVWMRRYRSRQDWFVQVMWLIDLCAMTHYACFEWFLAREGLIIVSPQLFSVWMRRYRSRQHWFVHVVWLIYLCAMTHYAYTNEATRRIDRAMGWLRLVGSIKLQVSFAEYSLFYRALLQKRPIILSILLTEATP